MEKRCSPRPEWDQQDGDEHCDPLPSFPASFVHGTKRLGISVLVTNVGVDGVRFSGLSPELRMHGPWNRTRSPD